ncbi:uncharacterized protein LOC143305526 [Osmia lignaria lignaria]|uniref:uncharacterized protein LOC143305526 n=1 Tax=Osmia lignaria lignaria TaxID=1437193 RepID=UPI00402BD87F
MAQIQNLYLDILNERCKLEKRTIYNSLSIASISPDEFAYNLMEHIVCPLEKSALLNTIARGMLGEESVQGGLINNLFTENTLSHIAENTWNKFVEKFIKFGSISSAVIMILIIIHICKLIIDTIIRGYTLHTLYGWSIKLLGAIFSSITYLLVTLKNNKNIKKLPKKRNLARNEDIELNEIKIERPNTLNWRTLPPVLLRPPAIKPPFISYNV